jgi:N-acetyl-1-D-myo-inositol-2-amino-2-deoxy-alpha-D-glucopyranoside deacetylase
MAGTPDNNHPHAFINARPEEVLPQLVTFIRRVQPHVVLTFEPFGGYGHPDHVAIHKHTHLALGPAADPAYRPELGRPWLTPRLFYPIVRASTAEAMRDGLARHGLDTSFFDALEARRDERWPDDLFHYTFDAHEVMAQKLAAFHCHQTQFGPNSVFQLLSPAELSDMLRYEYFALALPEPEPGLRLAGLFDGLVL